MKKKFKKELLMNKKGNESFMSSIKCWTCNNIFAKGDVKARDHCYVIAKFHTQRMFHTKRL